MGFHGRNVSPVPDMKYTDISSDWLSLSCLQIYSAIVNLDSLLAALVAELDGLEQATAWHWAS